MAWLSHWINFKITLVFYFIYMYNVNKMKEGNNMIILNIDKVMQAELNTIQGMILFNPEHAQLLLNRFNNKYSNILNIKEV